MIIVVLLIFGLCLGSFVNALVWRIHEQDVEQGKNKPAKKYLRDLSIRQGRSMCPHCKHQLKAADLVPVASWLRLRGKCRYCKKPISWQYPVVEAISAALFVASYIFWPEPFTALQTAAFTVWLVLLTGLLALFVYDIKWFLLPNKIVYPLIGVATVFALLRIVGSQSSSSELVSTILAVLVGGGVFYVLFQVSGGKWIGGGDVKLGWLLGLIVGTPSLSLLFIFLAAVGGSLLCLPLLLVNKVDRSTMIPFGPFLISGAIIALLFGSDITHWYASSFLGIY
jgi:prepilin signal peptidase PulO-like enzyme (type II secretory pathway)